MKTIILKTGPDRPVQPVGSGTGAWSSLEEPKNGSTKKWSRTEQPVKNRLGWCLNPFREFVSFFF